MPILKMPQSRLQYMTDLQYGRLDLIIRQQGRFIALPRVLIRYYLSHLALGEGSDLRPSYHPTPSSNGSPAATTDDATASPRHASPATARAKASARSSCSPAGALSVDASTDAS